MDRSDTPDLQPIAMLPTIAELIDGQYADSLKFVTIERVMAKSDFELGMDALTRAMHGSS